MVSGFITRGMSTKKIMVTAFVCVVGRIIMGELVRGRITMGELVCGRIIMGELVGGRITMGELVRVGG